MGPSRYQLAGEGLKKAQEGQTIRREHFKIVLGRCAQLGSNSINNGHGNQSADQQRDLGAAAEPHQANRQDRTGNFWPSYNCPTYIAHERTDLLEAFYSAGT